MVGESRKWMILVVTTWIQAFTGTNFDFSSYSSELKTVLGISQVQLNYLSVASDMGKALGWCSGVSLMYLPLWVVMFMAALMGLFGYGLQWFVIERMITLPYVLVFFLCLLAGCSICWFNTVCYVLCIRHFQANRALALSLTISFNGVSAALYSLIANAINPSDDNLYLFLNALVPLFISGVALVPLLRQPPPIQPLSSEAIHRDSMVFLCLYILAVVTGLYLLLLNSLSSNISNARILLVGAIFLLILPLCLPGIAYAREWACRNMPFSFQNENSSDFNLVNPDDLELHKELIGENENGNVVNATSYGLIDKEGCLWCFGKVMEKDRLTVLGEEHSARLLVRRWDFWLYYAAYFCGGTIGLVYSNNLGQISESLGYSSMTSSLVTLYSSCSFFGRLLAAAPDFLRDKIYFARTGWLAVALVPTPIGFLLLTLSGSEAMLRAGTGLIGISSGFVFSAAVSVTSELFGPNSAGVNHNILITNIPIGSLLYGLLAALVYDANEGSSVIQVNLLKEATLCMGRSCYRQTFIWWSCISVVGLASSILLFLRTRAAYNRFERNRCQSESSS
ncbi:PREDICTED: protein NUCLEAR FUSION DEFECTIVE 4-like isoform X1 [Fragaria vesca subsp. vesca]|uniref:protein NUCLEAR FUSION DEFECTIVE 4-like isoform X1 n=1 Tax=Fragaria vesca subsp. vesca TaxID=101020 RepID=UPI0002C31230|nr:PREDICTED: protein NUCLEAR FUSION DEFECTIVE 4-like isoform X1 [Fragaria vesca subsp. vesca]XP_011469455.1 PREDICTED: protein NUCLEAR FUSION DEFECTIVE 4-like isoform X1 [Fragaria vesca subsp. vesca]